ncbi:phosphopantetheine-binding protein [Coraliomargarita parva]|uniref:phosphopantetheine-binding protein n=1 Tax=Coraliomargarita parva TaxID=3014050 RepID=UPI0022B46127|nr:phosphopantetheine-binding protein [Coraliomargarita parva]
MGKKEFLIGSLKFLLVESLDLDDLELEDIDEEEALFGEGLGLDSIDALELVLQVEKRFGVKIKSSEETRQALKSIRVLAEYILEHAPEQVEAAYRKAHPDAVEDPAS